MTRCASREHLPLIRRAGLIGLWLGVEDLSGSLVKKGQNKGKTLEAFHLLRSNGIYPVPMLMHHDAQSLVTWSSSDGLLNQLRTLRSAGALYTQVLMLSPSPGSKWYADTYTSGLAIKQVDGVDIQPHIGDGNYVVASRSPRLWMKQLNLLVAYTYFFNPVRLAMAVVRSKSSIPLADADTRPAVEMGQFSPWQRLTRRLHLKLRAHLIDAGMQVLGMCGLYRTYRRTLGWAWHLFRGRIERCQEVPLSQIPMRTSRGGHASHDLVVTDVAELSPARTDITSQRRDAA